MTADDARTAEIATALSTVRERLAAAAGAVGRHDGDVELLVVTKFFPAADVARLITLGECAFGESREPEAGRKVAELATDPEVAGLLADGGIAVDMIGMLQSKKTRSVARWARAVHSVDRTKIADRLDADARAALDDGVRRGPLDVLVQVSLDGDRSRGGVVAADLPALADRVEAARSLRLRGLMTIAPVDGEPRRWMAEMAQVRAGFLRDHPDADALSAGMSGDLEAAVEFGSTCVRVGTAIMGSRPILSQ